MQRLWEKKSPNISGQKKIMQPLGTKKIMQMAPNYSKWFQMSMARSNGYGNGPTLSQRVPNGPKGSQVVPKGLRTKD